MKTFFYLFRILAKLWWLFGFDIPFVVYPSTSYLNIKRSILNIYLAVADSKSVLGTSHISQTNKNPKTHVIGYKIHTKLFPYDRIYITKIL